MNKIKRFKCFVLSVFVLRTIFCYRIKNLLIISNFLQMEKDMVRNWYQNLDNKLIRECVRFKIILSKILVVAKRLWGYSKFMFARIFLTPTSPTPTCSSLLLLHVSPLSTYVCFRDLIHPQKRYCNAFEFSNEKSGSEKRKKNYFLVNSK